MTKISLITGIMPLSTTSQSHPDYINNTSEYQKRSGFIGFTTYFQFSHVTGADTSLFQKTNIGNRINRAIRTLLMGVLNADFFQ